MFPITGVEHVDDALALKLSNSKEYVAFYLKRSISHSAYRRDQDFYMVLYDWNTLETSDTTYKTDASLRLKRHRSLVTNLRHIMSDKL